MSRIAFIRKTPAGGTGNFNYEYSCRCSNGGQRPNVIVTSGNDNGARALAQLECDSSCGEDRSSAPSLEIPTNDQRDRGNSSDSAYWRAAYVD